MLSGPLGQIGWQIRHRANEVGNLLIRTERSLRLALGKLMDRMADHVRDRAFPSPGNATQEPLLVPAQPDADRRMMLLSCAHDEIVIQLLCPTAEGCRRSTEALVTV